MTTIRWEHEDHFYHATCAGVSMSMYFSEGVASWTCDLRKGKWREFAADSASAAQRHVEAETLKLLRQAVKKWPRQFSTPTVPA